jgi:hypothetical protein
MKLTRKITWTAIILFSMSLISPAGAVPTTIVDNYEGSDGHGYGDVIGSTSNFQTSSMDVSLSGNMLTVSILTTFAGKADNHLFDSLTGGKGIGYGDLFLGSSWTPYGTSPYTGDNTYTGTTWTYGFSLDDRWMSEGTSGTGTLYSLNNAVFDNDTVTNNNPDALLSEDFLTGGTYRDGQEVAVNVTEERILNGDITAIAGSSSWSIDTSASRVDFMIDLTGTDLLLGNEIALHWGFTCANDVIEGSYSVPEPSILALLSMGLFGLVGVTTLKKQHFKR